MADAAIAHVSACAIGRDENEARERIRRRLERGGQNVDPDAYKASRGEAAVLAAGVMTLPAAAQQQVLNVATAGDQNMVDYIKDYLGPMFEKKHPGVRVNAVGTGPGDAGSQKIYEKLDAQKKGGAPKSVPPGGCRAVGTFVGAARCRDAGTTGSAWMR